MRVVVTGATGNVGTTVVRELSQDPSVDSVLGLARRPADLDIPKVEYAAVDVATDPLEEHLDGADAVVHLAWLFQPTRRPEVTWRNNVVGTVRVLEAVERTHVSTLVVASSVGAYSPGRDDTPVDESWPTHGGSAAAYAREKAYVERLLDIFEERNADCRVVRMRPGFLFQQPSATQQRRLFGGPLVPGSLLRRETVPVLPWPRGLRFQVLHTADAASAYRMAVLNDVSGAFNLAAEPVVRAEEVAERLGARVVTVPPRMVRGALAAGWTAHLVPPSPGLFDLAMHVPLMNCDLARDRLDWMPMRSSADALEALLTGLRRGSDGETPPLAAETSGPGRRHEFATGIGTTDD